MENQWNFTKFYKIILQNNLLYFCWLQNVLTWWYDPIYLGIWTRTNGRGSLELEGHSMGGSDLHSLSKQMILAVHFKFKNAWFEVKNMKSFTDESPKSELLQISHAYHNRTFTSHNKIILISKRIKKKGCGFHRIEDNFQ